VRLADLEPQFLRVEEAGRVLRHVDTLAEAEGIMFLCPVCFAKNAGRVGTHAVICWRPSVPQYVLPGPGRWEFEGTGYEDLTLRAGSSSVLLNGGCKAHFFVTDGQIRLC
jgi:hypothetical protein